MPWGRMDDKFHRNRKVRELRRLHGQPGREALGCWTFWWSWCLDDPDLTGTVPTYELDDAELESAKLLVSVGLWDVVDGGFMFHDFHEYNPSREQRDAKKSADRERVANKRNASRADVASDTNATDERVAEESEQSRVSVASTRVPSHSHPIPIPTHENAGARKSPDASRADRLRLGYLERFKRALPNVKPHGQTGDMSGGPWLDLARSLEDAQCGPFLDAYFADDWCKNGGYKLGALGSERVRLLTAGPTVSGQAAPLAPPASPKLAAALLEQEAAEEACRKARLHRDSVAGTEAHSEASRAHAAKQRELAMAKDRVERLSA